MDEIQRDHADAHGDVISLTLPMRLDEVEREVILWTLRKTDNNKPEAAQLLGISVKTLYNKLHEYRENTKVL